MHLGMPVVGLATTESPRAVPPEAGLVSNDPAELGHAIRALLSDTDLAAERGRHARRWALEHYGLDAFQRHWDAALAQAVSAARRRRAPASLLRSERSSR
jgi:glycosyltransferase involved in cell wall biosynthesis